MKSFEYVAPTSLEQVKGAWNDKAALKAGGIDLIDRMKEGIEGAERVVSLGAVVGDKLEEQADGTLRIGAGMTLAKLGSHELVRKHHAAVSEACLDAATPQVRNQATIAGNLLQRSRCMYFRLADFPCKKKGGDMCYAVPGEHHTCGVFDTSVCPAVNPSNAAVPLVAAGAKLETAQGEKVVVRDLADVFVGPEEDITREHRLPEGEVVMAVHLPRSPTGGAGWTNGYHEVRQRQGSDWALVSAAVYLGWENNQVQEARVVMGFVAPTPRRLPAVEKALVGQKVDAKVAKAAAAKAFEGAEPLPGTKYKIPMGQACLARAIVAAAGAK